MMLLLLRSACRLPLDGELAERAYIGCATSMRLDVQFVTAAARDIYIPWGSISHLLGISSPVLL